VRAHHYRIVDYETGTLLRREFKTLKQARYYAWANEQIAAMNQAGKVLRYLPVNPKAKR
jgi:hypothetical protein